MIKEIIRIIIFIILFALAIYGSLTLIDVSLTNSTIYKELAKIVCLFIIMVYAYKTICYYYSLEYKFEHFKKSHYDKLKRVRFLLMEDMYQYYVYAGDKVQVYVDDELEFTGKINYGQFKDEFTSKCLIGLYLIDDSKYARTYKVEDYYSIKKI